MAGISIWIWVAGWIASTAATALSSVGLWNYLARRQDRAAAREERDDERIREEHRECLARVDALEEELRTAVRRLEVVEHHHSSLFARWIKDAGKRICWVNGRAMATIFGPLGYTRAQVEGRTFQDLLDVEAAREIDRLDAAALTQPGMAVWSMIQLHHRLPLMIVVKVAGIGRDQELIFEGQAYHVGDPEKLLARAERREGEQMGLSQLRLESRADEPKPA